MSKPLEFTDRFGEKMWVIFNDDPQPEIIISLRSESFPIDTKRDLELFIEELQSFKHQLPDSPLEGDV